MTSLIHTFVGGTAGRWRIERIQVIVGQTLPSVPRLSIFEGNQSTTLEGSIWLLRGVTSYERYVHKTERSALVDGAVCISCPCGNFTQDSPSRSKLPASSSESAEAVPASLQERLIPLRVGVTCRW